MMAIECRMHAVLILSFCVLTFCKTAGQRDHSGDDKTQTSTAEQVLRTKIFDRDRQDKVWKQDTETCLSPEEYCRTTKDAVWWNNTCLSLKQQCVVMQGGVWVDDAC